MHLCINYKKQIVILLLLIGCIANSWAQGYVRFHSFTYAKQVVEGTTFDVRFTAKGAELTSFTPPSFEGFEVLGNPSVSRGVNTQEIVINGQYRTVSTTTQMYVYRLRAKKIGNFTIDPASATIKSKTYQTLPLSIQVVRNKNIAGKKKGNEKHFISLEIDSTTAVIGQHVNVQYKLYSTEKNVNFEAANNIELPDIPTQEGGSQNDVLSSFFRSEKPAYLEVIDGVQYYATVIKEYHVFPDKKGKFLFPALAVIIKKPDRVVQRGFFQEVIYKKERIDGEASMLFVKDFPEGRTASFSGIVGDNASLKTIVSQTKMSTDEGFTLRLEVESNMAEDRMLAPKIDLGEAFEVFDPSITTFQDKNEGQWLTKKIFDYTVLPKRAGDFTITPQFQTFDTKKFEYKILKDKTYQLNITKGSNPDARAIDNKDNAILNRSLRSIKKGETTLSRLVSTPFYILVLSIPLLALLIGILIKVLKKNNSGNNAPKKQSASTIATQALLNAENLIKENKPKEAFKAINNGILNYLSSKYGVELFSKKDALSFISKNQIDTELAKDTKIVFDDCELALFAPITNNEKVNTTYQKAKSIIEAFEKKSTL